jgi:tetratricopeptide (TPR) repeat protein
MRHALATLMIVVSTAAHTVPDPGAELARDPDYGAVRALIEGKRFAEALPLLGRLVRDYPTQAEVYSLTGFALRKTGRLDEALPVYLEALRRDPKHLGANEYLGELYAETGRLDLAGERLDVLEAECGRGCEETQDLAEAIARAEKR